MGIDVKWRSFGTIGAAAGCSIEIDRRLVSGQPKGWTWAVTSTTSSDSGGARTKAAAQKAATIACQRLSRLASY